MTVRLGRLLRRGGLALLLAGSLAAGGAAVAAGRRHRATVALAQLVEAARARADLLEARGDRAAAARALDEALAGPWPDAADPEVAVPLRSALLGRWARLRLDAPGAGAAERAAVKARIESHLEGMGTVHEDAFTARLLAILGEIHEAEGRDDQALEAYERALAINRALLQKLLDDASPP